MILFSPTFEGQKWAKACGRDPGFKLVDFCGQNMFSFQFDFLNLTKAKIWRISFVPQELAKFFNALLKAQKTACIKGHGVTVWLSKWWKFGSRSFWNRSKKIMIL